MNILSIHFGDHDSSACVLKNGDIVLYFLEERLSKLKRDVLPVYSIAKCIENFKETIDLVVFSDTLFESTSVRLIDKLLCDQIDLDKLRVNSISFSNYHHLSHASLAFYNSGFEESIVIVVDGDGTRYKKNITENESVYYAKYPGQFECIIKNLSTLPEQWKFLRNYQKNIFLEEDFTITNETEINIQNKYGGITNTYATCTHLINEKILEGGKVMGLSSYGTKQNYPKIFDEKYQLNDKVVKHFQNYFQFNDFVENKPEEVTKENYKTYADHAHELQLQTQEAVGNLIESAIKKTGCKKVCVSGGYGMNVVANHYYLNRFPDVEFYFEPNSDDGGLSIGAAKFIWHRETNDKTIRKLTNNSFHGVKDPDLEKYQGGKECNIEEIATLLYENKSVAIYNGLAESGRRALGNRSIFFNALNPDAKEIVNKIKKREWYRPFAAVVLEEDADLFFEMGRIKSSPFMTICFPVREEYQKIIPGVTHVDNTCRIQTVSKNDGYLYDLLQEFKKLSGYGVLLNTSLNIAGYPLVENVDDALETLHLSSLDYLWLQETKKLFGKNDDN